MKCIKHCLAHNQCAINVTHVSVSLFFALAVIGSSIRLQDSAISSRNNPLKMSIGSCLSPLGALQRLTILVTQPGLPCLSARPVPLLPTNGCPPRSSRLSDSKANFHRLRSAFSVFTGGPLLINLWLGVLISSLLALHLKRSHLFVFIIIIFPLPSFPTRSDATSVRS